MAACRYNKAMNENLKNNKIIYGCLPCAVLLAKKNFEKIYCRIVY